jgi:hypothetical protein
VFEHSDHYFNPRYVVSIEPILRLPNGKARLTVHWHDQTKSQFLYEELDDAEQSRNGLIYQVNKANGGL